MLVEAGLFAWFWRASLAQQADAHALEATRLNIFAQSALDSMQAKSIEEKVRAEGLRREYDVRTEMYRDAVAKQFETGKAQQKAEPESPRWVTTDTGEKVDMNQVDWMNDD